MRVYTIRREQWVSHPIGEVFEFFTRAENLQELTPPWIGFRIVTPGPIVLKQGTTLGYVLRIHGIPVPWLTEIERWEPPHLFVDVQAKGPYQLWRHTHRFTSRGGGTLMGDTVEYAVRFGVLGRIANGLLVARDVKKIFDYRERRIREIFP